MKHLTTLVAFAFFALLLSCSGIKVTTDSEKTTDFSQYKSFSFLGWQNDSDKIMNEFDKKKNARCIQIRIPKAKSQICGERGRYDRFIVPCS